MTSSNGKRPAVAAVLLDIGGVLTEDGAALPGAVDCLHYLRARKLPFRLLTNTSRRSRRQLLAELQGQGLQVGEAELITAPIAVLQYLQAENLTPYYICSPALREELPSPVVEPPDTVVVFDAGEQFCYAALDEAFQYLQAGAGLVAVGDNRYYRAAGRLHLDAGPFIHALEYAAGVSAVVIGKPAPRFYQDVVATLGVSEEQVLMVGDDIEADVIAASNIGLQACLVRSGKYCPGDEARAPSAHCIDGIAELPHLLGERLLAQRS